MTTDDRPARQGRSRSDDRTAFDRFDRQAYRLVSTAPFFYVCVGMIIVWGLSLPLWSDPQNWQYVLHTVASAITVLLLALLENANRRSDEASQEKLNVLAEAIAALMDSRSADDAALRDAATRLRAAVGLEDRH